MSAYDDLRGPREVPSAVSVREVDGVTIARFAEGRGFVTTRHDTFAGSSEEHVAELVREVAADFTGDATVRDVEWKTRAHDDHADVLDGALRSAGFVAGEPESVMIGDANRLAVDVPLPDGVSIRRVDTEAEVRAASTMADLAFGEAPDGRRADAIWARLSSGRDDLELWVAELDGEIVCTGRLEPVPGTRIAGLWGGATRQDQRGRGIYRALTAARARSALARGFDLLHSDSTEYSRPILQRAGLVKVTTTTPYELRP